MPHSSNEIRELSQAKKPLREFYCKRFKVCRILCGDILSLFRDYSRRISHEEVIFISLGFDDDFCRLFGSEEKTPQYFLITKDQKLSVLSVYLKRCSTLSHQIGLEEE